MFICVRICVFFQLLLLWAFTMCVIVGEHQMGTCATDLFWMRAYGLDSSSAQLSCTNQPCMHQMFVCRKAFSYFATVSLASYHLGHWFVFTFCQSTAEIMNTNMLKRGPVYRRCVNNINCCITLCVHVGVSGMGSADSYIADNHCILWLEGLRHHRGHAVWCPYNSYRTVFDKKICG